jgi:hypothetical protein
MSHVVGVYTFPSLVYPSRVSARTGRNQNFSPLPGADPYPYLWLDTGVCIQPQQQPEAREAGAIL